MKAQQFYDLSESLIDSCMEIMKSKGLAYSGKNDSFANFKRVAKNLCMSQYQVWHVYFSKHLDSLASWIKEEYSDSEPIESRIKDLINYLFLLYGMIKETEKKGIGCPGGGSFVECDRKIRVDLEDEEHGEEENS